MDDNDNFALVPRPPGSLEKAELSARRILSGMVADMLALRKANAPVEEWCRRGEAYYYGIGVQYDYAEAVKWFLLAADEGCARAQCWLGFCYQHGSGVAEDMAEGVRWFQKAAKQGEIIAEYNLGVCLEGELGISKDPDEMVTRYRNAAHRGHLEAQLRLGIHYSTGPQSGLLGTDRGTLEALEWLERAAEKGHVESQLRLGFIRGGCCGDYAGQIRWYRVAAQQGSAEGQVSLGACYERGEGVPQDYVEAIKWFRKAADQGDMRGQYSLGVCYENGRGVPCNYVEAVKWYHLAADGGLMEAQRILASWYERGRGVRQNMVEALRWYNEAAENGDAEAQHRVATHLVGISKTEPDSWRDWNLCEGFKWLRLSVEGSKDKLAENELIALRSSMKPEQIAKGEKLFLEFRDRKAGYEKYRFRAYQERPFEPTDRSIEPSRMRSLRIVIMDDEPLVCSSLRMMLNFDLPNGEILTFTDVEAALEELEREDPDLFTTDWNHAKMRCDEMLQLLAARNVKYPVFVISAYAQEEDVLQTGPGLKVAFLAKPFLLDDLRQLMSTHLGPEYGRV